MLTFKFYIKYFRISIEIEKKEHLWSCLYLSQVLLICNILVDKIESPAYDKGGKFLSILFF